MTMTEKAAQWALLPLDKRLYAHPPAESNELRRIVDQIEGAAPDLFLACEEAEEALEWYDNGENKAVAQRALMIIRAALKKAKGQS